MPTNRQYSIKAAHTAYVCAISAIFLSGMCSCKKSPDGVLDQEEMAQLMADVHMAEAVVDFNYGVFASDSARQAFKQSVYMNHGVNQDMVDSSLTWYGHHIEDYIKVYNRTIEILEERKDQFASTSNTQIAVAGDSVHVWTGPGHISVSPLLDSRMLSFCLTPDSTWQKGDIYTLSFKSINNMKPLQTRLMIDYANGSTAYAEDYATLKSVTTLKLQVDSLQQPERIYGYITFPEDGNLTYEVDSIRLTRIRIHLDPNGYYTSKKFKYGSLGDKTTSATQQQSDSVAMNNGVEQSVPDNASSHKLMPATSQRHSSIASQKDLPAPSTNQEHTPHRQGATEHKVIDRKGNTAKRQSAMPKAPLKRQPANARQMEAPEQRQTNNSKGHK